MEVMAAPTISALIANAACERFTEIARHHKRQNMEDRFIGSSFHRFIGPSSHWVIEPLGHWVIENRIVDFRSNMA